MVELSVPQKSCALQVLLISMLHRIGADQWSMASMRYGPHWRMHRKLFNEFFNVSAAKEYDVNQIRVISDFLVHLHQRPRDFRGHIRQQVSPTPANPLYSANPSAVSLTASLSLSISYGIQADTTDNKFTRLFEELLAGVKQTAIPGAFFVDAVPLREYDGMNPFVDGTNPRSDAVVRYLPAWFPGVQFHRFARKVREDAHDAMYLPFEHVMDALRVGAVTTLDIGSSANFGA